MRNYSKIKAFVILIIFAFISVGCSKPAMRVDEKRVEAIKEVTEAIIVDGYKSKEIHIEDEIKGGVKFNVETSKAVSLDFIVDGQAKSLEVTDGTGLLWRLDIPGNALLKDTKITMTPLTEVVSEDFGNLKGGVLLEPDGLQFIMPVTLAVSSISDGKSVMLSGSHDGSELGFSFVEAEEGKISSKLLHFSSSFADNASDKKISEYSKRALEQCRKAEKEMLELLQEPIEVPTPPSISLRCKSDGDAADDQEEIEEYVEEFEEPEREVVEAFLTACKEYSILTGEQYDKDFALTEKVLKRLMRKGNILIKTYKPQEEKLAAVAAAALRADRQYGLISGGSSWFIDIIADWTQEVADKLVDELKQEHDYCLITPILKLGKEAAILGAGRDSFLKEIEEALSFRLEFETVLTGEGMNYKLKGDAPIKFLLDGTPIFIGSGTGEYTSYTGPHNSTMRLPNSFSFSGAVGNFDPCNSDSFTLYVDRFGAKSEVFVVNGYAAPVSGGLVHSTVAGAFNSRIVQGGPSAVTGSLFYSFNVELQNEDVNAADESFSGKLGGMSVNYKLRLVHTPN